jgi:hypothetical protein
MASDPIEMDLEWVAETDLAYGVKEAPASRHDPVIWLPKSQVDVEEGAQLNEVCTFLIPEWLVVEKGLD